MYRFLLFAMLSVEVISCSPFQKTIQVPPYSYGPSFEGFIEYTKVYQSKDKAYQLELEGITGTKSTIYHKEGTYLNITHDGTMQYLLFNNEEGRIYYKPNVTGDTLWYRSVTGKDLIGEKYKLEENADTLLGKACDKLTIRSKGRIKSVLYYSKDYRCNPEGYNNATLFSHYESMKITQAVKLRHIISSERHTVDITATRVVEKKLDPSIFDIPKNNVLIKAD